jgi:tRNA A-37 threonylcarbamoyl transferase component Bud32
MIHLNETDYQSLREGAEVLEKDGYGDKVLRLTNGNILKLFRTKHFFSSARLFPYAKRFARNAARLKSLGIQTFNPLALYRLPERRLDAVLYEPLPGETIKDICRKSPEIIDEAFVGRLGAYIEHLHSSGIFFRSLHLGNIVMDEQNEFGLIDVADMRILQGSLSQRMRLRNFAHLTRMKDFCEPVRQYSECLQQAYEKQFTQATQVFKKALQMSLARW